MLTEPVGPCVHDPGGYTLTGPTLTRGARHRRPPAGPNRKCRSTNAATTLAKKAADGLAIVQLKYDQEVSEETVKLTPWNRNGT